MIAIAPIARGRFTIVSPMRSAVICIVWRWLSMIHNMIGADVRALVLRSAASLMIGAGLAGCLGSGGDSAPASNGYSEPVITIAGSATPANVQAQPTTTSDAARFADQTSFGANEASVAEVERKGPALALEEQFVKPGMGLQVMGAVPVDPAQQCPSGSAATCERDYYTAFHLQKQFFWNAVHGADQLRQRVAFALSQIIVVSANTIDPAYANRNFQQMLQVNAFGNYRNILLETTLSPVMGAYLNMVNNVRADPARGTEPNENYARELLQLFSVGEYLLNPDGTRQLDGQGNPISTYDQDTIENFARVFTGWTYPPRPGAASRFPNPQYFDGRMVAFAAQHDTGAKTLLSGAALPAGQTPEKDVEDAISNVFNHPNVGPYIGKQLIQFLVTSNPSPQYVARVTTSFNNNGQGVRGDMKAVLRAILLDAEARGNPSADANYGKLREPVLLMTGLVRALNGSSDGVYLRGRAAAMGQLPYESPTVFNFYPPDYIAPDTDVLGPQFKIMQTGTILARSNFAHDLLLARAEVVVPSTTVLGATGTRTTSSTFNTLAATPAALVDRLSVLFCNNCLSAQEKAVIVQAVSGIGATEAARRVRTAVYLVVTSAQYQVSN
jgi:uncharacterized protein (DUF1800 family)